MDEKIHRNVTPLTVLHRSKIHDADDVLQQCSLAKQSCILLVTRGSRLAEPVIDYAVNVADRMNCKILATYVNTLPLFGSGDLYHKQFASAIEQNAAEFKEKAVARGVDFEYVQESGKISKIISRLCRIIKRIEFVLIDQGIKIEDAAFGSPVPVFNIVCTDSRTGEMIENRRANEKLQEERHTASTNKKRYWIKTLVFGAITGGLYAAVFKNLEMIMPYFTKGGVYTLLPVIAVFVFLYVHGSLFSNFWSALGIEVTKANVVKKVEESKSVDKRSDTKPRVRTGA
jgi:nucleotide-binding universal stress UspA family protein